MKNLIDSINEAIVKHNIKKVNNNVQKYIDEFTDKNIKETIMFGCKIDMQNDQFTNAKNIPKTKILYIFNTLYKILEDINKSNVFIVNAQYYHSGTTDTFILKTEQQAVSNKSNIGWLEFISPINDENKAELEFTTFNFSASENTRNTSLEEIIKFIKQSI